MVIDEGLAEQMRLVGMTDAQIAAARVARGEDPDGDPAADAVFEVHEDAWDAVMFFAAVGTQWRFASGLKLVRTGLDYAGARCELKEGGWPHKLHRALWADMKVMEAAVLKGLEEKAAG